MRGADPYMERIESLLELAADARWWPTEHFEMADSVGSGTLVIDGHWTEGGGHAEIRYGTVFIVRDERMVHFELFDADGREAQDARFAALVAGDDLALASDVTLADRRPEGWGTLHGIEAVSAKLGPTLRGRAMEINAHGRLLATEHGLAPVMIGRDGEVVYVELHAEDAVARERFSALVADPVSGNLARVGLAWFQALNRRDLVTARACLADDIVIVDHRPASAFGDVRGAEPYMDRIRSLIELADDARWWPTEDFDPRGRVGSGTLVIDGHWSNGGGPAEIRTGLVWTVRDGRMDRFELFETDQREAQDARFAELLAQPTAST
jgi:ketosteroid isomerase-like protein